MKKDNVSERAVVVTGASSGIGLTLSTCLAENGFIVFATVRKELDFEKLKNLKVKNLIPYQPLDLTDPTHIQPFKEFILDELNKRDKKGIFAIVNNAGAGFIAPIELMDIDKLKLEFDTRVSGPLRLLQSFLPMIREVRGRIIWIVTPALIPIPFVSSIHANDFAVNCLARTLRIELKPWGIPVVMIRCGGIRTPAVERSYNELKEFLEKMPENETNRIYKRILEKEVDELKEFDKGRTEPMEVAKVVLKALLSKKPKSRYRVGYMAGPSSFFELFPQPLIDLIMTKRGKFH